MVEEYHSRFDQDHRLVCTDCYADWHDFMSEAAAESELDEMLADEELAHEIEVA